MIDCSPCPPAQFLGCKYTTPGVPSRQLFLGGHVGSQPDLRGVDCVVACCTAFCCLVILQEILEIVDVPLARNSWAHLLAVLRRTFDIAVPAFDPQTWASAMEVRFGSDWAAACQSPRSFPALWQPLLLRHSLHLPAQHADIRSLHACHAFLVGLGIPISFNTWQRVRAMALHAHPASLPDLSPPALARLLWALHGPAAAAPAHCPDDTFAAGLQHLHDFLFRSAPADAPQPLPSQPPRRPICRRALRARLLTTANTLQDLAAASIAPHPLPPSDLSGRLLELSHGLQDVLLRLPPSTSVRAASLANLRPRKRARIGPQPPATSS